MKLGLRRYHPIFIVTIYSLITIYLFEFGVVNFDVHDKFLLYFFLFFAHLGMISGYYVGIHSKNYPQKPDAKDGRVLLRTLYKFFFIISLITFLPSFMVSTHTYTFSFSNLISNIQLGLSDSSTLYNANRSVENVSGIWKIINIGMVLTGFIRWIFFPLSIYLWKELKKYQKVLFYIFAFFYLASFLTTGTTAGIFTISFITVVPFVMKVERQKYYHEVEFGRKKISGKIRLIRFIGVIGGVSACLWLFSNNMESRLGWMTITGNWSSFPWNIVPEPMKSSVYWFTSYIAQGYGALSYCIDLPFTSTFGIGGSWFLIQNFSSLLNVNILDYTYLGKAEAFGYGAYHNWHTVYVWLANDVSFIGVPILLFILFYLMAQSWRDYLEKNDPFAFVFMTIMGFFCLYISANNTVFSHSDTLLAFWIILYMWKRFKCKYTYE